MNNFLQPFLADGQQYTHDEFIELLISTLDQQLMVSKSFKLDKNLCVQVGNKTDTMNLLHIAETVSVGSKKHCVPWNWSSRVHSFAEGKIPKRPMLKASE